MNLKDLFLYMMLVAFAAGCSKEDVGVPIPYEVILENHLSYSKEETIPEQYVLFQNESDWIDFTSVIEDDDLFRADYLEDLDFNFNEANLVLIIGKYYNYCCSKIDVDGVFKENGDVVVNYTESGPGDAPAISQAYTLLKFSKEDTE